MIVQTIMYVHMAWLPTIVYYAIIKKFVAVQQTNVKVGIFDKLSGQQ